MVETAPFFNDVAEGPDDVEAIWATCADGLRLRLAIWPGGSKGTVLLFPGRTEYVEKYGRAAAVLNRSGYAVISIDWRGQGLADRMLADRNIGYVKNFADYQMDVAALLQAADDRDLPKPYYLLAHSMGGSIGLRALIGGLPVSAAVFTSPMWGIGMSAPLRPFAWSLGWATHNTRFGHAYAPGTKAKTYVLAEPFANNELTTDPDMYAYMQRQMQAYPEMALGGPSLHWLYEALTDLRGLARQPSPRIPTLTFLGTNERIVQTAPIHTRMAGWPGARLEMIDGAEHEVLMERPDIRDQVFEHAAAHFAAHP